MRPSRPVPVALVARGTVDVPGSVARELRIAAGTVRLSGRAGGAVLFPALVLGLGAWTMRGYREPVERG